MKTSYKTYFGVFFIISVAIGIIQTKAGTVLDTSHVKKLETKKDNAPVKDTEKKGEANNPRVSLETTFGKIVLELNPLKAPITVKNFISYVDEGFYNGLIFHRVIPDFMVQGGMKPDLSSMPTSKLPIKNESSNGLSNKRGSISMARANNPDSATAQFFMNLKDNLFLDYSPGKPGYAVFGQIIEGMDVLDAIARVKVINRASHQNVPEKNILITKAEVIKDIKGGLNKSDKANSSSGSAKKEEQIKNSKQRENKKENLVGA